MGKLARDYAPVTRRRDGHPDRCAVGRMYEDDFDDEDREWFDDIMADDSQDAQHVWGWLQENGFTLSVATLRRHRRKDCRCVRTQQGV